MICQYLGSAPPLDPEERRKSAFSLKIVRESLKLSLTSGLEGYDRDYVDFVKEKMEEFDLESDESLREAGESSAIESPCIEVHSCGY